MEGIQHIIDLVADLEAKGNKLFVENKNTSATDLRKTLQEIKAACQSSRKDALEHQKKLKVANKEKKAAKSTDDETAKAGKKEKKAKKEKKEKK
jgi:hypothetical protein